MPAPADAPHLLIPFAGRSSPACHAATAPLQLTNLEALLDRLLPVSEDRADADSLSPPHERALAAALGLTAPDGCLPWAALEAARAGLGDPSAGAAWAFVTLCHWDVEIDEVVLGDPQAVQVEAAESQALLAAARPLFEEDGIALFASDVPGRWLARSELFRTLATASPDRAIGQPISHWSAGLKEQRVLRRLQNEMQMLLYTQRINDERTQHGLPPINGFWLSGSGVLAPDVDLALAPPSVDLRLRAPALQDDGLAWVAAWQALDAGPLAALRAAQARGERVALTLCGDRVARRWAGQQRGPGAWLKRFFGRQRASGVLEAL